MPRQTNFTELCSNILGSGADLAVIDSQEELRVLSDELSYRGVAGSMWLDVSDKVNQAKPERKFPSSSFLLPRVIHIALHSVQMNSLETKGTDS